MHRCDFSSRIELRSGTLVRVSTAHWKGLKLDVLRETENGTAICRNLYTNYMGGYLVDIGKDIKAEPWGNIGKRLSSVQLAYDPITDGELETIYRKYPDFHYTVDKYSRNVSSARMFDLLKIWKEHKECELLIAGGFYRLAYCRSFYGLKGERRKRAMAFLKANMGANSLGYKELVDCMKYCITIEQHYDYRMFCTRNGTRVSYDEYEYLQRMNADYAACRLYEDYKKMAKAVGHDWSDSYWKFPKSIRKAHDKVLVEKQNIDALKELEALRSKQEAYTKAVRKVLGCVVLDGKFRAYIPESVEDIKVQADALHQCLIRCDYVSRVAKGYCKLVFVRNGDKPVATAEILPNGKIGQFYGDEQKRNMLPSRKACEMVSRWLETYNNEKKVA